jgi:hypothetical protein
MACDGYSTSSELMEMYKTSTTIDGEEAEMQPCVRPARSRSVPFRVSRLGTRNLPPSFHLRDSFLSIISLAVSNLGFASTVFAYITLHQPRRIE